VGCTAPYARCQGNLCVACGGSGERCCPPLQGQGNDWCAEPFTCGGNGTCH
jgi:hypothetical protein